MKCLETRTTPEGFKRRRYENEDGLRTTTVEIPLSVFNELVRSAQVAGSNSVDIRDIKRIKEFKPADKAVTIQSVW